MQPLVIVVVLVQLASLQADPVLIKTLPEGYYAENVEIEADPQLGETLPEGYDAENVEMEANPLWNQTLPDGYDPIKFEMQGDMIVPISQTRNKAVLNTRWGRKWPNGVVPVEIDPDAGYSN